MGNRIERVNAQIQKEVANIISYELNDPRLENELISVLRVETASDLKYVKIFVSIYGNKDKQEVLDAIKSAGGYIRKLLTPKIDLRVVPMLDFRLDESLDYSEKIDEIIKDLNKKNS